MDDIVTTLLSWRGRDDVPEELSEHLATAVDEITWARGKVKDLRKELDKHLPEF